MLNVETMNFNQRFTLMEGTGFLATADTLEEVDEYRVSTDDLTRHFMKIGDHQKGLIIDGCMYSGWKRDPEKYAECWREWK